ncbi:FAD-dependent oxidoreductase [Plantibacter flavus]
MDVVVIGAGIVGAAAARSLAESGRGVLLVERFERGHDRGSSHGATRIFRQGYTADDYVALTTEAVHAWRDLEARTGRTLLESTGAVDHGEPAMLDAIEAAMTRGGVASERLSPAAAAARWPGLRFDREVLHHASGGRLLAADSIEALLDLAEESGATLRFGVRVTDLDLVEGTDDAAPEAVLVHTSAGTVRAAHVVVAAGSWAPDLAGPLASAAGTPLPAIDVTQVQPAHFPTELPDAAWPSFVHYPADGSSVYGLLTPGEGVKVGLHGGAVHVHPDERDGLAEPGELAQLVDYVAAWVPGVVASEPATISCLYDISPDEDFVIDRIGRVVVATGFSGHGFKFGPVLGRLILDLVDGRPPHPRFALQVPSAA